jgi:FtsZ-binding cell division protein ZapB
MKPTWDQLMEEFKGHKAALVADVDCTAGGKALCQEHGVRGYPTLKYGDPSELKDYKGGRDFNALKKFAEENLKPVCSIDNMDLCDEEAKEAFLGFMGMHIDELKKLIEGKEKQMADAEETFKKAVDELQNKFKTLQEEKEGIINAVQEAGLGKMKSVRAFLERNADAGKEEL